MANMRQSRRIVAWKSTSSDKLSISTSNRREILSRAEHFHEANMSFKETSFSLVWTCDGCGAKVFTDVNSKPQAWQIGHDQRSAAHRDLCKACCRKEAPVAVVR
jgi:hypothetical protein